MIEAMDLDELLRAYLRKLSRKGRRLADALRPVVFDHLRGRVESVKLEDLVQETLVSVFAGLHKFEDRGEGSFRAWVRGIARNKALESYRHDKRGRPLADVAKYLGPLHSESPAARVHWRELLATIRAGLDELDAIYSAAVIHMAAGRDPAELAEIEDVSPNTILSRASRGRAKLRKYVRKRHGSSSSLLAAIS